MKGVSTVNRESRRRWECKRRSEGGCISCRYPASPGMVRCESCRRKRRGSRKHDVRAISRVDVLADLQAVAARLGRKIITTNLYKREGSYCLSDSVMRKVGAWSDLCVEAGLLPTYRGCRGVDRQPCRRCQRETVFYTTAQRWCYECRRTVNRRKTEYGRMDVEV